LPSFKHARYSERVSHATSSSKIPVPDALIRVSLSLRTPQFSRRAGGGDCQLWNAVMPARSTASVRSGKRSPQCGYRICERACNERHGVSRPS
jgi:hypothetical protein